MADILICQAAPAGEPKRITVYDEHTSGGVRKFIERVILRQGHASMEIFNVPFADYQNHQVGSEVLVLVQPLYDFAPACLDFIPACDNVVGEYSPCVNKRMIADEAVDNSRILITNAWVNSTGNSCQILMDHELWSQYPEFPVEYRRYPFRILPIRIDSCL